MGCQLCKSQELVMAAAAAMGAVVRAIGMAIEVSVVPGLLAKDIRPRDRRFPNPAHVVIATCELWLAVAACIR